MLDEAIEDFKKIYTTCADRFEGFAPREQQKRMSFEIVKALANQKTDTVIVAEAGTGVGKSMAYLMSVIPMALKLKKTVVISTATIALQEQLINKDIPLFKSVFHREFSHKLVKGRSNYVCSISLLEFLEAEDHAGGLNLEDCSKESKIATRMLGALNSTKWNGERSSWPTKLTDQFWNTIKSDSHSCKRSNTDHLKCPFTKARDELQQCDVIIANHALVFADLSLADGGGVILTEAEETIYIFDEAHHLPLIARDSVSGQFSIKGLTDVNDSARKAFTRHSAKAKEATELSVIIPNLKSASALTLELDKNLVELNQYLAQNPQLFNENTYLIRTPLYHELALFKKINDATSLIRKKMKEVEKEVSKKIEDDRVKDVKSAEQILSDIGFYNQRYENIVYVLGLINEKVHPDEVVAKWVDSHETKGFTVNASPVESSKILTRLLWDNANNVILTSATLSSLGNFNLFGLEAGIPKSAKQFSLGSPFDYQNKAELYLPPVTVSPTKQDEFTNYLSSNLFKFIENQTATLVLFSSYWQMDKVKDELQKQASSLGYELQCQRDSPKEDMLKNHARFIAEGKKSILMGTGSFAEGLDLPRELLTNVIITKIPFGNPQDPISTIHSEHIQKQGGNSFFDITLPSASRNLIQAAGRLIRTVEDSGRVIILDNRMTTKRYGSQLLSCLPPFKVIRKMPL